MVRYCVSDAQRGPTKCGWLVNIAIITPAGMRDMSSRYRASVILCQVLDRLRGVDCVRQAPLRAIGNRQGDSETEEHDA